MREPFFFGIPLIARSTAGSWSVVEHLLGLTLRSLLAQEHADFRVLLAAHDCPLPWQPFAADPRFTLLHAGWAPEPPSAANDDGGRKKWLIKERVREEGGGLLMFLDADDWVSRDLVRIARSGMETNHVAAIVENGFALDYRTGHVLPFPIAGTFEGAFHELCGSSTIARIVPDATDRLRFDPHAALGSHHQWLGSAARLGATLARLDTSGVYLVGTGENHSERDGPFTGWRAGITQAVRDRGVPMEPLFAGRFGQILDRGNL